MKGGFGLFNFFVYTYEAFTNKAMPGKDKISNQAKISFNSSFTGIKNSYGFTTKGLKGLIYYSFLFNPLNIKTEEYGKLTNIIKCAKPFSILLNQYKDEITEDNIYEMLTQIAKNQYDFINEEEHDDLLDAFEKMFI